ncbi:hypothetical protein [Massilibacterium senegalense]|uniref:hypothetical protein n=1 Tax=Massilibacterium senegalense TaxID=1632858 RepID=UPI0007823D44|nr:hypothetical protein [Massilibacterium senegalense]
MRRKLFIFLLIMAMMMGVIGCSDITEKQKSIYNNDEKIIQQADSYTYTKRISTTRNNETKMRFQSFAGMETIYREKDAKSVIFEYDVTIQKGDFKIVLVTPEKKVVTLVEGSEKGSETIKLKNGENKIKIVGKDAKGTINYSVK